MTQVSISQRKITFVEPDDSVLEFWEVLLKSSPSDKTLRGRLKAVFAPWTTVAVPMHLAEAFPAGMAKLNGQPLWEYKLVDGVAYSLRPTYAIEYS